MTPLRAAEREPLAPEVLESIDALARYWSKTVVREATIRENLISLCREVAAGYAKPSLPPDGERIERGDSVPFSMACPACKAVFFPTDEDRGIHALAGAPGGGEPVAWRYRWKFSESKEPDFRDGAWYYVESRENCPISQVGPFAKRLEVIPLYAGPGREGRGE